MTLDQFFHMGGYGFYIWTSYGIAFVVLALNIILPVRQQKRALKDIANRRRRNQERMSDL